MFCCRVCPRWCFSSHLSGAYADLDCWFVLHLFFSFFIFIFIVFILLFFVLSFSFHFLFFFLFAVRVPRVCVCQKFDST